MANLKTIAATLAILGTGALAVSGCNKEKQTTETPDDGATDADADADAAGADAAAESDEAAAGAEAGEMKCGEGHTPEGHCGAEPMGGETPPAT